MALTFTVDSFVGVTGSSCVSGTISGSFSGSACGYTGSLTNFSGVLTGYISGNYYETVNRYLTNYKSFLKRSILKFDLSSISASISSGDIADPKFILNLKTVESTEVPSDYKIYAFPISQSWDMGIGTIAAGGGLSGINWKYRKYPDTSSVWYPNIDMEANISGVNYLDYASTASFKKGGGTWYYSAPISTSNNASQSFCSNVSGASYICTQSFSYSTSDIKLDITKICQAWICGCIPNEGIILLTSDELNPNATSNLKFFSRETNTIYSPYIDVQWPDFTFDTGSLSPITSSLGVSISIKNLKKEYKSGSKVKFTVFAREQNPKKQFSSFQSTYLNPKYLPTSSFYSIKDNESEEVIIGFDDYTKLSCDAYGNYFYLDTTGLPQERYYRILIKTELSDGSIQIFDNGDVFKIVR